MPALLVPNAMGGEAASHSSGSKRALEGASADRNWAPDDYEWDSKALRATSRFHPRHQACQACGAALPKTKKYHQVGPAGQGAGAEGARGGAPPVGRAT